MSYLKNNIIFLILFIMMAFTLSGCEEESFKEIQNTSLSICVDSAGKVYKTDLQDSHITPDYRPLSTSFVLTGDKLYFINTKEMSGQNICELSFQNAYAINSLPIDLGEAAVKAIAIEGEEAKTTTLYCLAMNMPENGFMAAFSSDGGEIWKKEFDEGVNQLLLENEVLRLIRDGDGRFYALTMGWIFLFNSDGDYRGKIECPGKAFIDISLGGKNGIYATYQGDSGSQSFLAKVRFQEGKLTDEKRVLGNGYIFEGTNNTLLLYDSDSVYSCETDSERVIKLFDLKDYNIVSGEIRSLLQTAADEILMVNWRLLEQSSPVELISFREIEGKEIEEKQTVTLIGVNSSFMEDYFNDVIVSFNKQSNDYKVVLDVIDLPGDTDSAINTRLMAKESADILYIADYKDIEKYQGKGYLEDLTPYLERSETIGKEDYLEEILKCLEVDGKLYGMSEAFGIDTLMGRVSELGDVSGWTQEEFLSWMKQNPKAKSPFSLDKVNVLEYCLKGNLSSYVDWETGNVYFEGEAFKELLSEIYALDTDDKTHYDDWFQILVGKEAILEWVNVGYFEKNNIEAEHRYGDELVFIGYPGADKTPRHLLNMSCLSVLNRSNCKEGAFAFLEYVMGHKEYGESTYFTKRSDFEAAKEKALEKKVTLYDEPDGEAVFSMTEKQLEKHTELLKYAVADTLAAQTVRGIILEEAQAYFQGDKELSETCRIIQSRVQLYVKENQ